MKIRQTILAAMFVGMLVAGCGKKDIPAVQAPTQAQLEASVQLTEHVGIGTEQVVIFKASHQEAINYWLIVNKGKVEITRTLQSQSGDYAQLTITIFYVKTAM